MMSLAPTVHTPLSHTALQQQPQQQDCTRSAATTSRLGVVGESVPPPAVQLLVQGVHDETAAAVVRAHQSPSVERLSAPTTDADKTQQVCDTLKHDRISSARDPQPHEAPPSPAVQLLATVPAHEPLSDTVDESSAPTTDADTKQEVCCNVLEQNPSSSACDPQPHDTLVVAVSQDSDSATPAEYGDSSSETGCSRSTSNEPPPEPVEGGGVGEVSWEIPAFDEDAAAGDFNSEYGDDDANVTTTSATQAQQPPPPTPDQQRQHHHDPLQHSHEPTLSSLQREWHISDKELNDDGNDDYVTSSDSVSIGSQQNTCSAEETVEPICVLTDFSGSYSVHSHEEPPEYPHQQVPREHPVLDMDDQRRRMDEYKRQRSREYHKQMERERTMSLDNSIASFKCLMNEAEKAYTRMLQQLLEGKPREVATAYLLDAHLMWDEVAAGARPDLDALMQLYHDTVAREVAAAEGKPLGPLRIPTGLTVSSLQRRLSCMCMFSPDLSPRSYVELNSSERANRLQRMQQALRRLDEQATHGGNPYFLEEEEPEEESGESV